MSALYRVRRGSLLIASRCTAFVLFSRRFTHLHADSRPSHAWNWCKEPRRIWMRRGGRFRPLPNPLPPRDLLRSCADLRRSCCDLRRSCFCVYGPWIGRQSIRAFGGLSVRPECLADGGGLLAGVWCHATESRPVALDDGSGLDDPGSGWTPGAHSAQTRTRLLLLALLRARA